MTDNIDMRIAGLIDKYKQTKFQWGTFDCCQFAADAVKSIHGVDIQIASYRTEFGARRVLARMGGTLPNALAKAGMVSKPIEHAERGDIVTVRNPCAWGQAVGVVVGAHAVCPGYIGLITVERDRWVESWGAPCHK